MEIIKKRKPKILQVCAIDNSVESLLKPLILESMKQGYEVHNACRDTGKFTSLINEGLIMKNINIDRSIAPLSNVKSIISLYKLIRKEKYDIVHVHTPVAALLGRIAARLAGTKNIIYTAHGFYFHEEMSKKKYSFFFRVEKLAAKWLTDWLLLQSIEDYNLAIRSKFKKEEKTIHISNGVDIWNKFNPALKDSYEVKALRKDLGFTDNEVVFSFIGRLVREKGIFELIEAFKTINQQLPNAKLILIGGVPKTERDKDSYTKLQEELKHPNILYLGYRTNISELMLLSDCFILPSHREGLPRSIIEAMAMQTPIIASNIRGCREEVFQDINGMLFTKGDSNELAIAMEKMVNNKEMRDVFSKKSREIVEESFDEQKVLNKQIEIFNKITSKA